MSIQEPLEVSVWEPLNNCNSELEVSISAILVPNSFCIEVSVSELLIS